MPENENDKLDFGTLVKAARNQLLVIIIAFATSGLWLNYQFLTSINSRIDSLQTMMEFRFGTIEKTLDKVDNKVDKVNSAKNRYTPDDEGRWGGK